MGDNDNVKVAVRVRPLNQRQLSNPLKQKISSVNLKSNSITLSFNAQSKTFQYDFVGDQDLSQQELFQVIGRPITASCLSGYNGTIFAYGQTGAGKTFTIIGGEGVQKGLLPRSLEFIFSSVKAEMKRSASEFHIKVSFLQIYNEMINDLLNPDSRHLQLRQDPKRGIFVQNLTEEPALGVQQAYELLQTGLKNRHTGETMMNRESSRSHSVFTLYIESKQKREDQMWNFKQSRFHLIDLAGSERQRQTSAVGQRLKQAGAINKSLSVLGNVINSLVQHSNGKSRYIHYRDSKLTLLLKDSLGGNSKTCIIANISPSGCSFGESLSTLRFADSAKLVKNRAVVNEDTVGTVNQLREEVRRLNDRLREASLALKNQSCGKCTGVLVNDYSVITINQRLGELEKLLQEDIRLRLVGQSILQQEIQDRQNYIQALQSTLGKYQNRVQNDKLIIRLKQETIKNFQQGFQIDQYLFRLQEEISILRKENENNPIAAKLFVENDALKHHLASVEKELHQNQGSLVTRLKQNQEFTNSLDQSLKKSVQQRKQLLALLEQHNKYRIGELISTPVRQETENLESRIKDLQECLSDLDSQLTEQRQINAQQSYNKELFGQLLSQLQFLNNQIDDRNTSLQNLRSQFNSQSQQLTNTISRHQHQTGQYQSQIQELSMRICQLKQTIQFGKQSVTMLNSENQILSESLTAYQHSLDQKQHFIQHLNQANYPTQISILQQENSKLQQEIHIISNQYSHLQQEFSIFRSRQSSASSSLAQLQSKLKSSQRENSRLKLELDQTNKQNTKLAGHNNPQQKIQLHARMKEENNKLKQQVFKLQEELRRRNKANSQIKAFCNS